MVAGYAKIQHCYGCWPLALTRPQLSRYATLLLAAASRDSRPYALKIRWWWVATTQYGYASAVTEMNADTVIAPP